MRALYSQTTIFEAHCIEQVHLVSQRVQQLLMDALTERMLKKLNSKPGHDICLCVQVAAVSGDVRRCLELLRRAAEITEAKTKQAAASDAAVASSSGQLRPTGHTLTGTVPAVLSYAVLAYNL